MNYLQHFLFTAARIIKLCPLNISLSFSLASSLVKDIGKKHCLISQDILIFPLQTVLPLSQLLTCRRLLTFSASV